MAFAEACPMKAAITQCPILSEVEARPQPLAKATAETRPQDRRLAITYICKTAMVLSGVAMVYGLVSFGRIFENYLQW